MGNPTKFRGRDCTYDLPGRMATMRDGNNWSMGYKYRSDGLIGSRAKTIYVLSRTGQWTPVTGNPTYFLHDSGEPLFELAMGANFTTVNAINIRGPDGLIARKFSSNWTYYEFDQQGSVSQRLNSSGVVQSSSVYGAYGKETNNGSPSDPFGYNAQWGYWLDRETGMYLCQARWYDPVTARWVNRDPIGYAGGSNLYGYCGGGPVGAADSYGQARVVLRYRKVVGPGYHAYITVHSNDGSESWAISGGPTYHGAFPGGPIKVFKGPYDSTSYDWHPEDNCDDTFLVASDKKSVAYWMQMLGKAGAAS